MARIAIIPSGPPRVNRALSAARVERGYQLPERVLAQAVLEVARLLVGTGVPPSAYRRRSA